MLLGVVDPFEFLRTFCLLFCALRKQHQGLTWERGRLARVGRPQGGPPKGGGENPDLY